MLYNKGMELRFYIIMPESEMVMRYHGATLQIGKLLEYSKIFNTVQKETEGQKNIARIPNTS
jgi:hypothetical protein